MTIIWNSNLKKDSKESPWDAASVLSKYFLQFMSSLINKGITSTLKFEDIPFAPKLDSSRRLGEILEQNYKLEVKRNKNQTSFAQALWKTFRGELVLVCLAEFFAKCIAAPMQAVALGWIIRDASTYYAATVVVDHLHAATVMEAQEAYRSIVFDSIVLIFMIFLSSVLSHPFLFQASHVGMKMRVASCHMIYKKSLKLSQSALSEATVGQMVNLLSNDVSRFDQVVQLIPHTVIAPIQAAIILVLLASQYIGLYPTLASFLTILLYMSVETGMGKGFSCIREKTARRTDERVRLLNEIILAIRVIKMYAWENPFKMLVEKVRKLEMRSLALNSILRAINQTMFYVAFEVILSVALITFVLLGGDPTPEIVFVSMNLVNLVSLSLTLLFPSSVTVCGETFISCKRINHFLLLQETKSIIASSDLNYTVKGVEVSTKFSNSSLIANKISCTWSGQKKNELISATPRDQNNETDILRNLSFTLKPGDLMMIIGFVGTGKSSVLMTLLGELPIYEGRLEMEGNLSYASQEAWIFSGSVRDNILLDNPYQPDRYAEVIRVCSLERDLEILVDGDATIVGERGVSLSGGQRARVNLARALYAEADIYLLDDPLSAVDGPVARHIFSSMKEFLKNKTVVLATHQLQFLRHATKVLVVDRELPAAFGTLQEVMDSDAFKLLDYGKTAFTEALALNGNKKEDTTSAMPTKSIMRETPLPMQDKLPDVTGESDQQLGIDRQRKSGDEQLNPVSLNLATIWFYIKNAAGPIRIISFLTVLVISLFCVRSIEYFLSLWSDTEDRQSIQEEEFSVKNFIDTLSSNQIIMIYVGLIVLYTLANLLRASIFFSASYRASIKLHKLLFESILYAPIRFFDFTPIGILLNRVSRDMGFVDEILPEAAIEIIVVLADVSGNLVVVLIIDYLNLIGAIPLLGAVIVLQVIAFSTITQLKQMEGVTRSPIFSHISTTLAGLSTIRASQAEKKFMADFDNHQDNHSRVWFSYICTVRWLSVGMDLLCNAFVSSVVVILLVFSLDNSKASLVGLVISQAIMLPAPFQWGMRHMIELESQMTSVQRIKEFCELEREESEAKVKVTSVGSSNPNSSAIVFSNISLSYFPDEPPVLKNISFTVKPGEKVGVVGRTGAGKSSIVSVLFRLYDFDGSVRIGDTDTGDLSLAQLRNTISIIPQDPVLFSGTLRKNLDPFDEYSDDQIWSSLEAVQLKQMFSKHPDKLEYIIKEGGNNFSVGQRQLICLARAIVRQNQILVLDEATANVDPETDMFIQRTISEQFAHCTVLTIAHRLITIAKADRVLVLDRGEVKEFAAPSELIEDKTSLFSQMVEGSSDQATLMKQIHSSSH